LYVNKGQVQVLDVNLGALVEKKLEGRTAGRGKKNLSSAPAASLLFVWMIISESLGLVERKGWGLVR
jgi:hypothetical protein